MRTGLQQPAVVIMAKQPLLGAVKTRLAPALTAEQRSELYAAFLLDRIDQVAGLDGVLACVAFTPPSAATQFESMVGGRMLLLSQSEGDLGQRLVNVASRLFASGCPAVVLVDSDTPTLPTYALEEAVRSLLDPASAPDAVIGPARDGGYDLIGTRRPQPALFDGIPWSTARVLSETTAAAERSGLSVRFLQPWYDVDTPQDLRTLTSELAAMAAWRPGYPRRTAEAVARLCRIDVPMRRDER